MLEEFYLAQALFSFRLGAIAAKYAAGSLGRDNVSTFNLLDHIKL